MRGTISHCTMAISSEIIHTRGSGAHCLTHSPRTVVGDA